MTRVAVIDIGKTNAKLALVDRATLAEIAVVTRPNTVQPGPPWPHFDLDGHWNFLLGNLRAFQAGHGVDAISITAHGASVVLLDAEGNPAAPMLDYEHPGPDDLRDIYDRIRPPFTETGSPRLAGGLNVGAQVHWMFATDRSLQDRTARILTYPQYWAWRLTGMAATERTSLGCHTDLWNPAEDRFSSLVETLGIAAKLAPVRLATEVLGPISPEVASLAGLDAGTPVSCGIHDSNASLLPHLKDRKGPFSVVSTGTWVVVMTIGGIETTLDPDRDTLINVNAFGDPVPSARFMGGREFETITGAEAAEPSAEDIAITLEKAIMISPSIAKDTGPFKGRHHGWLPSEPEIGSGPRQVAAAYYCALMTATCLELTGHRGDIVVEGPFARNACYVSMLAAASRCPVLLSDGKTGTSQGASLLVSGPPNPPKREKPRVSPPAKPTALTRYSEQWRRHCVR